MRDTRNIKFCAYLRYKRIHPDSVTKLERGKAIYHYALPEVDWHNHKQDFNKSAFIEYANCLEAIKDLAY